MVCTRLTSHLRPVWWRLLFGLRGCRFRRLSRPIHLYNFACRDCLSRPRACVVYDQGFGWAGLWICVGLGVDPGSSPARPPAARACLACFYALMLCLCLLRLFVSFRPFRGGGNEKNPNDNATPSRPARRKVMRSRPVILLTAGSPVVLGAGTVRPRCAPARPVGTAK